MDDKDIRIKSTPPFKLKDKASRRAQFIHLKKQFGFIPEIIIIEKVMGSHDTMIVRAVLTKEEMDKEDERIKSLKQKKDGESINKSPSTEAGDRKIDISPGSTHDDAGKEGITPSVGIK